MEDKKTLQRFIDAQESAWQKALSEIKAGKKRSHWMWFIFPQIQGLGSSDVSKFYAIADMKEAAEYLAHPVLGSRLIEISRTLLQLPGHNANQIFGSPDNLKLNSSMTLFAALPDSDPVFEQVIEKYFQGKKDSRTIEILKILRRPAVE